MRSKSTKTLLYTLFKALSVIFRVRFNSLALQVRKDCSFGKNITYFVSNILLKIYKKNPSRQQAFRVYNITNHGWVVTRDVD